MSIILLILSSIRCLEYSHSYKFSYSLPPVNFYRPSMSLFGLNPMVHRPMYVEPPKPVKVDPINPTATWEGRIFRKLDDIMTPIVSYFKQNSQEYEEWTGKVEAIMSEEEMNVVVNDVYSKQPADDKELKGFWQTIMGELMVETLPGISEEIKKLEDTAAFEKNRRIGTPEFHDFENKRTTDDDEFLGTVKFIRDTLTMGISNRSSAAFTEVIKPFLEAAVAFKALNDRFLSTTSTYRGNSIEDTKN